MRTLQSLLKTVYNKRSIRYHANESKTVYNKSKAKYVSPYRIIKRNYSGIFGNNPNPNQRPNPNNMPTALFIILAFSFITLKKN